MRAACCEELDRLRAQVREQAEELAEWRRGADADGADDGAAARRLAVERWLKVTPNEARILLRLVDLAPRIQSRASLLAVTLRLSDEGPSPKIVDRYVCRLRKALRTTPDTPLIRTVRGVGHYIGVPSATALRSAILTAEARLRGEGG